MIYERLRACSDGGICPTAQLVLTMALGALDGVRRRDTAGERTPGFALDAGEIRQSVNRFHWRLLEEETERFYREHPDIEQALDRAFRVRTPFGELDMAALRRRDDMLLLRVGRFGQFESKSIDGLRSGWNAKAKRPMTVGSTRNLVRAAKHAPLMPFGWLLLAPLGTEPLRPPPATAAQEIRRSSVPRSTSDGPRYFLDGEPVEIVRHDHEMVQIRSAGGDLEWVDASDLETRR